MIFVARTRAKISKATVRVHLANCFTAEVAVGVHRSPLPRLCGQLTLTEKLKKKRNEALGSGESLGPRSHSCSETQPCRIWCAEKYRGKGLILDVSSDGLDLGNTPRIWLILPVVICLFQGLSHASVRVLGVYLERSVYGSLNGLLSTQRRMCICHPNGITLLTAKLIPVRRTSYLSNSGVTSGLLHCGARCASPKQKPTPFFGS